jgi:diguanylate cyclase (GGDEF)-like protein/PAS domain S-box-containing protein
LAQQLVRVLLVEDDEVDRLSFQRMCRTAALSYDLHVATCVAEAVAVLPDVHPDVVVTDYNLGDGTAFDLRHALDDETPMVIITGASNQEIAIQAIREGVFDYLVKDTHGDYLRMLPVTIESAVARAKARRQLRMLSQALMSIYDAVYVMDSDRRILFANAAFKERYGCDGCVGEIVDDVYQELAPQYAPGDEFGLGVSAYEGVEHRTRSGACSHVLQSTSVVRDSHGKAVATVVVIRDISEIVNTGELLRRYATTDELTQAMSRHFGLMLLEKQMALAARSGQPLTVCYVDIDHLKHVNDTYGHQEGDSYITQVTRALSRASRLSDSLCRLGGDEFLMVLPECKIEEAEVLWSRVETSLKTANKATGRIYRIEVSHGFAQYEPGKHTTVDQLIAEADAAMYSEKASKSGGRPTDPPAARASGRRVR